MTFRADIHALRALAVGLVVLCHVEAPGFHSGYFGVDVFFVISGFLMTSWIVPRLEDGTMSLSGFYAARLRRTLPALAVMALACLFAGWWLLPPRAYAELGTTAADAVTFTSNFTFWHQSGYFEQDSSLKPLLHTWSLSVEWQFYLLYPLALLLARRLRPQPRPWLVSAALLVAAASWLLTPVFNAAKPTSVFYLLPPRAWEMLLGAVAYLAPHKLRFRGSDWLGWLLIAASLPMRDARGLTRAYFAALPVVGTTLVIAADAQHAWYRNALVRWMGRTSYSMYLWHWPLVVAARLFLLPQTAATQCGIVATAALLAECSYRFVEEPLRRARAGATPAQFLSRAAGAVAVVWSLGMTTSALRGVPQRVSEAVRQNDAIHFPDRWTSCSTDEPCAIGPRQRHRLVVWGDSHAGHLFGTFEKLAADGLLADRQPVFMARNACPPLMDITKRNSDCRDYNQAAFALASSPDVDAVVLAARWSTHLCGRVYDSDPCTPDLVRAVSADRTVRWFSSAAELHTAVKAQLKDTITALAQQGKRVWLVAPVPMYRTSVAGLIARHHMFGATLSPVQLTRAQHERLHATALRMLRELARETPARIIEPAEVLCAGAACLLEGDRLSLYLDTDHLTRQGARLLAPLFARALE